MKFRAIEHMLTRMQAVVKMQASTRVVFASNASKGQILRALLN